MKLKTILYLVLGTSLIIACENDDNKTLDPGPQTAQVMLQYDFNYGSDDFILNQNYIASNGEVLRFSLATFYLSKPVIMDDVGGMTPLAPEYYLVRSDVMMSDMGTIEAGHAHMFNISLGIDEATNTENGATGVQPTDFTDANHPLAPQPEGMYWSWASGYIFVKVEGEVDYDADGTFDNTFKYHLGTNEFRKDRSSMLHTDVLAGDTLTIIMEVDYATFLEGVDLQNDFISMSMGAQRALGMQMMSKFDSATTFRLGGHGGHN